MSSAAGRSVIRASGRGVWPSLRRMLAGFWHSVAFSWLLLIGLGPVLAVVIAIIEVKDAFLTIAGQPQGGPYLHDGGLTPVVLILCTLLYLRRLASLTRRLAGRWCGVSIARPYHAAPQEPGIRPRLWWLATDPATWRDLLWTVVNSVAGTLLVVVPVATVLYGIGFALLPGLGVPVWKLPYVGVASARGGAAIVLGLGLVGAGLVVAPRLLPVYGSLARLLLGPTRGSALSNQVEHLTRSRSDTIDAGAAELRRIERDLHDGAQARLVAMGMTLDAIEQQLDANPDAARALLAEAKQSSVKALSELRDLVRGIHPPVLADRGLVEAVRALALDSPLRAHVTSELTGRAPAPVESAAYFAVSELLANTAKHAGPCEAWIDFRHSAGMLRITVTDGGRGGADQALNGDPAAGASQQPGSRPARDGGLHGIERRLAAFDGVLAVSSPPGGPTVANMEIPCALS
jgi:signal transduction histidine kinase